MKKNILIGFLLVVVVTFGIFIYLENKENNVMAYTIENNYNKSLDSILESFEKVNSRLSKISVSNDEEFIEEELLNLYGLNLSILENINNIPINHEAVVNAYEFLNKTTNYYYSLVTSDKKITKKNKEDIKEIYDASDKIYAKLDELNSSIKYSNEDFSWISDENVFYANDNTKIGDTFKAVNEEINEYPTLIFDGPFSDSINTNKKVYLSDNIISVDEGRNILKKFIDNKAQIDYVSNMNSSIECFSYQYEIDDVRYYANVSKRGGKIISINSDYDVDENTNREISVKEGIKLGKDFLEKIGIKDMSENYYETNGNVLTVNYVYNTGDVMVYPDLIKVKISLSNKEIVGFEATNYYSNHKKRAFDGDIISKDEVLNLVNQDFEVSKVSKALIPTNTNEEKYCYEVKGKYDDEIYIIYLNAKTGDEEEILKVIQSDESVLTM